MAVQYDPKFAEQGRKLCLLGATQADLAEFFGISVERLRSWELKHPEFREALELGRAQADAEVADRLFRRAIGYKRKLQKAFQHQGQPVVVDIEEEMPPDTIAGIFWLKNRRRENWRDRHDHDVNAGESLISILSGLNEPKNVVLKRPIKGKKKTSDDESSNTG